MDSPLLSDRETFTDTDGIFSFATLLEQGLTHFRQRRYVEAITCCTLAREQLAPDQAQFAATIDAFIDSYDHCQQAQLAFHQASRCFVEAEDKQQAMLLAVENLLLTSVETLSASSQSSSLAREFNSYQETYTFPATKPPAENHHRPLVSRPLQISPQAREDHDGCDTHTLPALYIVCFGNFEVWRLGQPVTLCQNRNGQAILRYLVAQPGYRASIDSLMGTLWPDDEPDVARHKVQVAVSALRGSLKNRGISSRGGGYILSKNGVYFPNPATSFKTDVDEFLKLYQEGRQSRGQAAIAYYERACRLYRGPFLAEDIYADWTFVRRDQLSQRFLTMCHALVSHYLATGSYEEAAQWASAVLQENHCDEEAHRQLMQAYIAGGRRSEALRQFRRCEQVLHDELGVVPMLETISLFQSIALGQNDSSLENENRAKIERK